MALSSLQKLFKNSPPPARILASLNNQSLKPTLITQPTTCPVNEINPVNLIPLSNPSKAKIFSPFDTLPFSSIHPSLGLFSYPILTSIGDVQKGEDDDSGMWADSVKKKRKKKMNKHKYKKLRKKLRRKT